MRSHGPSREFCQRHGLVRQPSAPCRGEHKANCQDHRINVERRNGEIAPTLAHDLHAEDRCIRAQERFDAGNNGGHITRSEDRFLTSQENAVSRQIGH